MKITKWVDMGAEVEVEISFEDIRCALSEYLAEVTKDRLGEPTNLLDLTRSLNQVGAFLRALTDEQIAMLNPAARALIHRFLTEQSSRYSAENITVTSAAVPNEANS